MVDHTADQCHKLYLKHDLTQRKRVQCGLGDVGNKNKIVMDVWFYVHVTLKSELFRRNAIIATNEFGIRWKIRHIVSFASFCAILSEGKKTSRRNSTITRFGLARIRFYSIYIYFFLHTRCHKKNNGEYKRTRRTDDSETIAAECDLVHST